jgi:hypothetical protein
VPRVKTRPQAARSVASADPRGVIDRRVPGVLVLKGAVS